ncbi:MAG: hypothetical protein JRG97_07530 [Deltaproteobacteria bacterium]|nr:hypothetical protein [Deltaproteobacteria bacterium]MBW2050800.1 hypothetical protein [Deltaproteobacteria bacterium]MBW2140908.1 hypothetical protein [Deltaproteobacteria bacterium]MBW2322667.1 hypothetical protein [Deltaproteobacteria bacterium]
MKIIIDGQQVRGKKVSRKMLNDILKEMQDTQETGNLASKTRSSKKKMGFKPSKKSPKTP